MLAFIDVEASSLIDGYPIEIGWAREDGQVGAVLVRPHPKWGSLVWDPAAERIHGLSRALLEAQGVTVDDAVATLNEALRGCKALSDAPSHDWRWLGLLLENCGAERKFEFELLAVSAHTLLVFDLETVCERQSTAVAIADLALKRGGHTAAGDAAALAAAFDLTKLNKKVEKRDYDVAHAVWRKRAAAAAPWRGGSSSG
jgi:hypothetical protein